MNKLYLLILLSLLQSHNVISQSYYNLDVGFNSTVTNLFYDSDDSILYAGGIFWELGNGIYMNKISQWNGVQWDSLGSGVDDGGLVLAIAKYNSAIFVGGSFTQIGGIVSTGLATWNGNNWNFFANISQPGGPHIGALQVYGNELYIGGSFDSINGIPAYSFVRYDGFNFYTYPVIGQYVSGITSIEFYNGELYVGGNFDGGPGKQDIIKFDGTSWQSVGGGLSGGNTIVDDMIVYNGELYISGHFLTSYGDPGNLIAKWNGMNWSSLGSGLIGGNCFDLQIFNSELYIGGSIINAGGIPVMNIAKWNGNTWSNVGANFNATIADFESFNNELFIGGSFTTINSDTMNRVARFDLSTGFNELQNTNCLAIYPNPASSEIYINCTCAEKSQFTLTTSSGKVVFKTNLDRNVSMKKLSLDLPDGMYFWNWVSDTNNENGNLFIIK